MHHLEHIKERGSHYAITLTVLGAVLFLGACETQTIAARPYCDFGPIEQERAKGVTGPALLPPVAGSMTPMPLNSVTITDWKLTNKILVQAASARRTETGTVEVWSRLTNCTDYTLQVEARTQFLDANQAPAEIPTIWKRLYLSPKTINTYTASSLNTAGVDYYYIELREGS